MTDIKRNYSHALASPSEEVEEDLVDSKKFHTKPGRKPIDTEPKSKRTAQNRAAQRAYRERKERKMKDLEDRVKMLEDENVKATTETDFLHAQVNILKNELAKYRGTTDFSDLELPQTVGHLTHPQSNKEYFSHHHHHHHNHNHNQKQNSDAIIDSTSTDTAKEATSNAPPTESKSTQSSVSGQSPQFSVSGKSPQSSRFSFGAPWSKDNLNFLKQQQGQRQKQGQGQRNDSSTTRPIDNGVDGPCPDLVSGSSTSTTPLDDNILVSPDSIPSSSNITSKNSNLEFAHNFEEQIDPFCSKLNEACGTKANPIPKQRRTMSGGVGNKNTTAAIANSKSTSISDITHFNSPFSNVSPNNQNYTSVSDQVNHDLTSDIFFNNLSDPSTDFNFNLIDNKHGGFELSDPLSFLNDNNFDASLAFQESVTSLPYKEQEVDPISLLTTEDSVYDFTNTNNGAVLDTSEINTNFSFNDFIKNSLPEKRESDNKTSSTTTRTAAAATLTKVGKDEEEYREEEEEEEEEEDDDENDVVPAPQETMKCSEIWDRITAHPRYTELDIDGLCAELKSKAKCSEKGVVINTSDVNELLSRTAK
ncbi:hypothetical protein KGF56_001058 [Candida oxycetoniae]|uniref:BZIP domain-containing protein n=1 Tax=Candida oxycetoniae TaxID=497107 RepID=A0AAI9SZS6_9ASCO|nr:uncharacterized protein KGF56_001058 [Candida oxycetoniae]KAI3406216.2 hypothetical protein KGF56_001058 [Candida oxycetoniae]